jgi:hypothetical protein
MVVVAIAAVALGANDVRLRRNHILSRLSHHEFNGRVCLSMAERHASTASDNEREAARLRAAISSGHYASRQTVDAVAQVASSTEAAAASGRAKEQQCRARARYHDVLRIKYERAARYPWNSVEADPPEPE